MEEAKVQNKAVANATDKQDEAKTKLGTIDGYYVLPGFEITREPYITKKGNDLWSYGVEVEFYNAKKTVGLQTPNDKEADWNQEKRDKFGYQMLDVMFEALGKVPLAIKFNLTSGGDVRSVEYFAVGIEEYDGKKHVIDHIPLATQKASSEALLRSAINRASLKQGWGFPIL